MIALPVGSRRQKRLGYVLALTVFVFASVLTAALVGSGVSLAGRVLAAKIARLPFVGFVALAGASGGYGLTAILGITGWIPQRSWQVPSHWARYGQVRYASLFGAALGSGFLTRIPFIGYQLLLVSCFLRADLLQGGLLLALFGLARTLPISSVPLIAWVRNLSLDLPTAIAANAQATRLKQIAWEPASVMLFVLAGSAVRWGLMAR